MPSKPAAEYASLAEAVLSALWPVVQADFAHKAWRWSRGAWRCGAGHGLARGRTAERGVSDLDLIVIYDAAADAQSDGRRPLDARSYYARLTKAFLTAISAPTAEGRLYEVDMRLRPSGRQGPVATSLAGV